MKYNISFWNEYEHRGLIDYEKIKTFVCEKILFLYLTKKITKLILWKVEDVRIFNINIVIKY